MYSTPPPQGEVAGAHPSSTLQVEGYDELFAVGDCATMTDFPKTPKAGVYAVRQGPYLIDNLRAKIEGKPLAPYRPQGDYQRSAYRHEQSVIGKGRSADRLHIVETWGRGAEIRPYGE